MLTQVVGEIRELLAGDDEPTERTGDDAFQELVAGIGGQDAPVEAPADPALARLFPDAYRDDPEAAAEWRRLTESGLRAQKRANADRMLADLGGDLRTGPHGGKLTIDDDTAEAWLAALNDVRLVLGVRLDVTEDGDPFGGYDRDDPRAHPFLIYHWLTAVQDGLVRAVSGD